MNELLRMSGTIGLGLILINAAKKGFAYLENNHISRSLAEEFYEDCGIYKAARAFEREEPAEEVKRLLSLSYQLNAGQIDQVLNLAMSAGNGQKGRYEAFIRSINQVLGKEVYRLA